jgi:hypothetical protein
MSELGTLADIVLIVAGLLALGCVMFFLAIRPARNRRTQMHGLLSRPLDFGATTLANQSPAMADLPDHCVFISYRRADTAYVVGRLYDDLASTLGAKAIYKDVNSNELGMDFRTQLERSLNGCHVFLCVMGEKWAGPGNPGNRPIDDPQDFVRIEVETALRRNIPVIPVFVGGITMPSPDFFPASLKELAYRHGLPLRPNDFHHDVARLISSVIAHLEKRQGNDVR